MLGPPPAAFENSEFGIRNSELPARGGALVARSEIPALGRATSDVPSLTMLGAWTFQ